MKKIVFITVLLICSVALVGMFYLIFQELSVMMVCCAVSGLLFLWSAFLHIFIVSSIRTITIKNSSLIKILDVSSFLLFAWTLLFIFASGSYRDVDRDLTVLYVGYVVMAVITLVVCLMTDRGGSISEEDNKPVQHNIQEKGTLLRQLCSAANDLHEKSGDLDNIKQLSSAIDMMRNIPARVFENSTIYSQLHECVDSVVLAVQEEKTENISLTLSKLIITLKANRL